MNETNGVNNNANDNEENEDYLEDIQSVELQWLMVVWFEMYQMWSCRVLRRRNAKYAETNVIKNL